MEAAQTNDWSSTLPALIRASVNASFVSRSQCTAPHLSPALRTTVDSSPPSCTYAHPAPLPAICVPCCPLSPIQSCVSSLSCLSASVMLSLGSSAACTAVHPHQAPSCPSPVLDLVPVCCPPLIVDSSCWVVLGLVRPG